MNFKPGPTFCIGITGTIGSGKTFVGKCLEQERVPVLDLDRVVQILLDIDADVQEQIKRKFGEQYLVKGEGLQIVNRQQLGLLIYQDPTAKAELEKIIHPAVRLYTEKWAGSQIAPVSAVLIPLLFEADRAGQYEQARSFRQIWAVTCEEPILRLRLKARSGMTDSEIDKRLAGQLSQSEKARLAHRVVDNSGSFEQTKTQVLALVNDIRTTLRVNVSQERSLV
jgi:dephospho-CoA kinase